MGIKLFNLLYIIKVLFLHCYFLLCVLLVTSSYNEILKFNQKFSLFVVGSLFEETGILVISRLASFLKICRIYIYMVSQTKEYFKPHCVFSNLDWALYT